jgi:8-oxo-dGTP pyrophosphatase MutT (NUDIX family)
MHKLRILGDRRVVKFANRAADVQDALGELQDAVMAKATIERLVMRERRPDVAWRPVGCSSESYGRRKGTARLDEVLVETGRQEAGGMDEELKRPEIHAAGGVLWRRQGRAKGTKGVEVMLIHRPQYDDWSLPKGKLEPGETAFEAALREVWEETGYHALPGRSLGKVRYLKASRNGARPKVTTFWAMKAGPGSFEPGNEVDRIRWTPLADARDLLTYPTDREILGRFASQPVDTRLLLLVATGAPASAPSGRRTTGSDLLMPRERSKPRHWPVCLSVSRRDISSRPISCVASRRSSP